jgi:hypothetical protein
VIFWWRGAGGLVLPFYVIGGLGGYLIGHWAGSLVGIGLAGIASWLIGRHLNRDYTEHIFYSMPMQF